jgi:hypothetical protein
VLGEGSVLSIDFRFGIGTLTFEKNHNHKNFLENFDFRQTLKIPISAKEMRAFSTPSTFTNKKPRLNRKLCQLV